MRILVSNDDGIHATGLQILITIAKSLSDDVWVVAPEQDQSGAARSLTLTAPLRVREIGDKQFAVSGTPTDCVQMGVGQLLPERGGAPDLVLSGVNNGQNLAEDITLSGTIAAAFQGMQLGIPSVALSIARFEAARAAWETPRQLAPDLLQKLLQAGWSKDVILNINFPDCEPGAVAGIEITRQGRRDQNNLFSEKRTDLRGRHYYWYGFSGQLSNPPQGTDLRAIYEGRVSITPLHLALTHGATISHLSALF